MGNIYTVDSERKIFIYDSLYNICLRTVNYSSLGRPVILCNDFKEALSTTLLNDIIYYSYKNIENDIVIKNVISTTTLFIVEGKDSLEIIEPFILTFNNKSLLTYIIKNPINSSYSIKSVYPFENNESIEFPMSYNIIPVISYLLTDNSIFFIIKEASEEKIFKISQ